MLRPTSVTVFGILNIVFGLFGLLGSAFTAVMMLAISSGAAGRLTAVTRAQTSPPMMVWLGVGLVLGTIAAIVLIAAGIGLLNMKPWGRRLSIGYAIFTLILLVTNLLVNGLFVIGPALEEVGNQRGPESAAVIGGVVGGLFGGCLGAIYPLLLWYFMTRPNVVAALGGAPEVSDSELFAPMGVAAARELSSNPYLSPSIDTPRQNVAGGPVESVVQTFIPSRNGPALVSYYLGLLSLLPCLGGPLGVVAVYYGLKGRRMVRENPAVRGGAHAWVGIICGALFGTFNFLLLVLFVLGGIGALLSRKH